VHLVLNSAWSQTAKKLLVEEQPSPPCLRGKTLHGTGFWYHSMWTTCQLSCEDLAEIFTEVKKNSIKLFPIGTEC
jgi:hypothetical protein